MNPYHDARGRFTSKGGASGGRKGKLSEANAKPKQAGGEPFPPRKGYITLYHGTQPGNADSIMQQQKFHSYQSTWFNTSLEHVGSRPAAVAVQVPRRLVSKQIRQAGKRSNYDVYLPRGRSVGKIARVR